MGGCSVFLKQINRSLSWKVQVRNKI